ncbi:MAG: uroporphyrinogen decarboxylase [Rhodospirillales bacterium]|nr:uroporphyrinogen decarboxylase [Rhodospirillales bacterium]
MSKLFLRALQGETLSRPPFWLMRQAGRYLPEYREIRAGAKNFLDFCYTPDLAVEATLQPLRRYGMDAAILFSDILVVPDALGQKVEFKEGEGPVLESISDEKGLSRLNPAGVVSHLEPVFETVERLSSDIPKETALIGFAGAPWTVAVYMVEGRGGTDCGKARDWAYRAPEEFQKLIDLLVDSTATYLIEQIKHGAEAVQLFDSWAGVLSESQFRRWVIGPNAALVEKIHQVCPGVPVIGFPRNAGALYADFVRMTKVDGVSIDHGVAPEWARDHIQPHCTVQGNLDNIALRAGGDALEVETSRILNALTGGPFIFNLGHGILLDTPPEHVSRLADILRAWPGEAPHSSGG